MPSTTFPTIAERWQRTETLSGITRLPAGPQQLCQAMYYTGFAAGLQACIEAAAFDEDIGSSLLSRLETELKRYRDRAGAATGSAQ